MKLVTASLFSRLPARFCVFTFAALWTLLLPGRNVHADPLELQATLVEESQVYCYAFSVQGSNFSFQSGLGNCVGYAYVIPGDTLHSSVYLFSPTEYPNQGPTLGNIDVPENPGRVAVLTGDIGTNGPNVTVPLDATGIFQIKVPTYVTGTLSACLLPADVVISPPCDPNYLNFANVNVSVFGYDVFNIDCADYVMSGICGYTEGFTGSAVPEPANLAAIGLAGLATLFVFGRRRIAL